MFIKKNPPKIKTQEYLPADTLKSFRIIRVRTNEKAAGRKRVCSPGEHNHRIRIDRKNRIFVTLYGFPKLLVSDFLVKH